MTLSPSQIKTVRHQFDCFCKKVLREESRDYERQLARRREKETNFSDLPETVLSQIGETDDYPSEPPLEQKGASLLIYSRAFEP